jgi:glycine cleavage system H protein
MNVPDNLRYRKSHEWIDLSTDDALVGITHHAQAELTAVAYAELPKLGRVVHAGEQVAVLESVKAASDIYAPVSGTIVAVNEKLLNDPGLINRDPYLDGWIFKIKPSDVADAAGLLSPDDYRGLIA